MKGMFTLVSALEITCQLCVFYTVEVWNKWASSPGSFDVPEIRSRETVTSLGRTRHCLGAQRGTFALLKWLS